MGSEVTTTAFNDVYFAAYVSDVILDEVRPYNVTKPFMRHAGPEKSLVYQFPIQDDPGVGATYNEGTGLSNTAMTTSNAQATAVCNGQMATVTDESEEVSVIDVAGQVAAVLGRAVAEYQETVRTALLDDFSNTSGTASTGTTYGVLLAAVNALEQRDMVGTAVGVLDPSAIGNVRADLGTSAAAFLGTGVANASQTNVLNGYCFSLAGSDWYQTSLVTSTGGGVFLSGVALGEYTVRDIRIETQRDASLPGTEVVGTSYMGVIEIRDTAGQTILTN